MVELCLAIPAKKNGPPGITRRISRRANIVTHNWWGIYLPISCEFLPLSSLYTNQWKKSTKLFHWRFMCRWGHPVSPKRRQRNHVIPPSESAKISQAFFRKLPGVSDSSEVLLPLRKAVAAAELVLHGSFRFFTLYRCYVTITAVIISGSTAGNLFQFRFFCLLCKYFCFVQFVF